jgi:hypothetical protein
MIFFLNLYFHKYREINLTIMMDMSTDIRVFFRLKTTTAKDLSHKINDH